MLVPADVALESPSEAIWRGKNTGKNSCKRLDVGDCGLHGGSGRKLETRVQVVPTATRLKKVAEMLNCIFNGLLAV